jgi:ferrous iron transport protein B
MTGQVNSFVAKENTIAAIGVLYQAGGGATNLSQELIGSLSSVAALAFLVVQMQFIPCIATVAVMHHELNSWRWVIFSIAILLVISFGIGISISHSVMFLNL